MNEVLQEYMIRFYQLQEKVELYDSRIEAFSQMEEYKEDAAKLQCFIGVISIVLKAQSVLLPISGWFQGIIPAQRTESILASPRPAMPICEDCWSNRHTAIPEAKSVTNPKHSQRVRRAILHR